MVPVPARQYGLATGRTQFALLSGALQYGWNSADTMAHNVQILRMLRGLDANLQEAIRCYALFRPTGSDKALIARINAAAINPGTNVISDSLHKIAVVALCRIWDKQGDAASLHRLLAELRKTARAGKVLP